MAGKYFVSRKTDHPVVAGFLPQDFAFWYDPDMDYMNHVATSYVEGNNLRPVFYTLDFVRVPKPMFKDNLCVDAELKYGKGSVIFSQLTGLSRLDQEPVALIYYRRLMSYLVGK